MVLELKMVGLLFFFLVEFLVVEYFHCELRTIP